MVDMHVYAEGDKLTQPFRCFDEKTHDTHHVPVVFEYACSGKVECGAEAHNPHRTSKNITLECSGVCRCGLIKKTHGPGAHK